MTGFGPTKLQIVSLFVVVLHCVRASGISASLSNRGTDGGRLAEQLNCGNARAGDGRSFHGIVRIRGGDGKGSASPAKKPDETDPESHLSNHPPFLSAAVTASFDALPTMLVEVESFLRDRVVPGLRDAGGKLARGIGGENGRGVEIESYFRDRVLPTARDARERFVRRMDDHRRRKERERREQLKRNEMWREKAEQRNATPVASSSSSLSSYSSSNRKESGKTPASSYASSSNDLGSSSVRPVSMKTTLSPARVLKLSLVAVVFAEALDRIGVLYEDTPEIVTTRIRHFWQYDVLRVYADVRSRLEGWYHRRLRSWIAKLRVRDDQPQVPGDESGWWWRWRWERWRWIGQRPYDDGPAVWSTTKVAFTAGAAFAMITTPLLFSCFARIWRPVLAVVAFAETNHHFKTHGRKFVEVLGETPQTLGAALDGLLEQLRWNLRRAIHRAFQSKEKTCREGHGSVSNKRDDRYGDAAAIVPMGGGSNVAGRKAEKTKRSKGDDYSLGISAYGPKANRDSMASGTPGDEYNGWHLSKGRVMRDFDTSDECTIEVYNRKRITMAKLGFAVGCAIGIATKGR